MWKGKRLSTRIKATVSFFPFQSTVNAYLHLHLTLYLFNLANIWHLYVAFFVANIVAYVKVTNIHRVTKKSRQRVVFSEPKNELSIPKKAGSEMFLSSLGTCVSPTRVWWHVGRVRLTSQFCLSEDFSFLGDRLCPFYVETSFL